MEGLVFNSDVNGSEVNMESFGRVLLTVLGDSTISSTLKDSTFLTISSFISEGSTGSKILTSS